MIKLKSPIDMHLHLREGDILKSVLPFSTDQFVSAVIMPNLIPPITTLQRLQKYKQEIIDNATDTFKPLIHMFLKPYTYEELKSFKDHIFGMKLYPAGITTNSENGVNSFKDIYPTLEMMQELNIPLSVHGESNGFVLDREREFKTIYEQLATDFPKLKITMEHVGTRDLLELLDKYENIYATVTLHHLLLTLDDLAGGMLNVHYFCKPIIKTPKDKDALQKIVKTHPKVMFGSDSAPHPLKNKYKGAAGVFTAPIILPALAEFFEDDLDAFQNFISNNAINNFNLNVPNREIILEEKPYLVPGVVNRIVPMWASKTLKYSIKH